MKKRGEQKGYLLLELMVAISVFVVGILGFLGLLSGTLSLNREIADKFTANYLAAEGVELTKNLIDADILDGNPWNRGNGGRFNSNKCFEIDYLDDSSDSREFNPCNSNSVAPNFLRYSSSTGYTYSNGNSTPFRRYIRTFNPPAAGNDQIKVESVVTWQGRGGSQNQITLEDYFFNPLP